MAHVDFTFIPPYINGSFVTLHKPEYIFTVYNPAKPNDPLAKTGWSKSFVDPIIVGMHSAQKKFFLLPLEERLHFVLSVISFLRSHAAEIKSHMMLELARSRISVEEEWALCEKLFACLPAYCMQILSIRKDEYGGQWQYAPLGSILISTNVSLPVYSLLASTLSALVAGNAVCVRPALQCVLSASLLARAFHQAAVPNGLIQIVYGDFEVFRRLVLTHQFHVIQHTGDEESLEQIRRDTHTKQDIRLVLCGGGKNASYVTENAPVLQAIQNIAYGACVDAGQRLESTSLVFLSKKVTDEFVEKFIDFIKKMPIGVSSDLARSDVHVMGPLCSSTAWERFLRFQGIAARESSDTLRWGKSIDNLNNGYFVSPGVHLMSPEKVVKSIYASNAFFGPDVCLVPVEDHDQVISILDSLTVMRCLSVHTDSQHTISLLRNRCPIPSLLWNTPTTELNPLLPTMGRGAAGNSAASGAHFLLSTVYPQTLNVCLSLEKTKVDSTPLKGKKKTSKVTETSLI